MKTVLFVQLLMFCPHLFLFLLTFTSCPLNLSTSPGFFCPSCTVPPLPPPLGFSGYLASLVQTSWGFFQQANYRQLGAQRITFSMERKAEARGQRVVLWNTQILDRKGRGVCMLCCIKCVFTCVDCLLITTTEE